MEIETLFGLPAHPLIVHAIVVLVPLAAIGIVLAVFWRPARGLLLWASCAIALFTAILTPFATGSGEELEHQVDESELVEDHAEAGDRMIPFTILLFVGGASLLAVEEVKKRRRSTSGSEAADGGSASGSIPPWVTIGVSVLAVVTSVAAVTQTAVVGHSGAKATWSDVEEGGEEGED